MTVQELTQALVVNLADTEGKKKMLSTVNPVQLCGPIVEVVDEYVQFVHFTAKE